MPDLLADASVSSRDTLVWAKTEKTKLWSVASLRALLVGLGLKQGLQKSQPFWGLSALLVGKGLKRI